MNPISGGKDKKPVIDLINTRFPSDMQYEFMHWEKPEQEKEIIQKIREGGYDAAIAVGGDGTINRVGSAVKGSKVALGIIPLGSGNGLARHLGIPLHPEKALEVIGRWNLSTIDSGTINGTDFFCTCGVGFDALIGKRFAESHARGLYTYVKLTLSSFMNYKPQDYKLSVDGKEIDTKAFLVTFANAAQYGNNAYIAPKADITDGKLDVSIIKPFKTWNMPGIGRRMFNKTLDKSAYVDTTRGTEIIVERSEPGPVHYDGEPMEMGRSLRIAIEPASVNVIVP